MYLLLLLTSSILWLTCNADPKSGLFVFGDSLLDVGTNDYISVSLAKATESPYGIDFSGGKATGRFGNGKIYPDFVADYLGQASPPPFLCPDSDRSKGINFASAGAAIMNNTDNFAYSRVIPFASQVDQFRSLQGKYSAEFLAKSIFLVCVGNLDILAYRENSTRPSIESYSDLINIQLGDSIQDLIGAGARKFYVLGLPPLGCSPRFVSRRPFARPGTCDEETNHDVEQYHVSLQKTIDSIKRTSPGSQFSIHDLYGFVRHVIANLASFGLGNDWETACCGGGLYGGFIPCGYPGATTCCSDRKSRLFWDL